LRSASKKPVLPQFCGSGLYNRGFIVALSGPTKPLLLLAAVFSLSIEEFEEISGIAQAEND